MPAAQQIETRPGLTYATHDGVALLGDLYVPAGAGPFPALVAVHGGGWQAGARTAFQFWGPYLAARGYVLFAISYRLAKKGQKMFPQAVTDVLAAVQFVRGSVEMWQRYQLQSPRENNIENFMGCAPMDDPRRYFDASPINYATFANNHIGVFLSVGTEDDLVNRRSQTDAFLLRLKQANFFVRPCIAQGAPHYWLNDPIEEPGSYSGFMAPRLIRFLQERL